MLNISWVMALTGEAGDPELPAEKNIEIRITARLRLGLLKEESFLHGNLDRATPVFSLKVER